MGSEKQTFGLNTHSEKELPNPDYQIQHKAAATHVRLI